MRRGEIRWVDLDPVRGTESNKRRPAVIVSDDGANMTASRLERGVVTVDPVTTNTDRVHPFQVLLLADDTGLASDSKAQAEQVRSVAVERIGERAGVLSAANAAAVDGGASTALRSVTPRFRPSLPAAPASRAAIG